MNMRLSVYFLLFLIVLVSGCRQDDLVPLDQDTHQTPLGHYKGSNDHIRDVYDLINRNIEFNPKLVGLIGEIGQPSWDDGMADTEQPHFSGSTANLVEEDKEPFVIIPLVDEDTKIVTGLMSFDRIDDHRQMLNLYTHNSFSNLTKDRLGWEGVSDMYLLMLVAQNRVFGDNTININGVEVRFDNIEPQSEIYVDQYHCVDWEIYFPNDPEPSTGTNCHWVTVAVEDVNVILEEDDPFDDSDGGGGNGDGDGQDQSTPCAQADSVVHRQAVIDYLAQLKLMTSENKEHVKEVYQNAFGDFRASSFAGNPGEHEVVPRNSIAVLDGMHHNHFVGGSSIFSEGDILNLYNLYSRGRINNVRKFMFGVVTAQQTAYILMINDENLFKWYGENKLTGTNAEIFAYTYSTLNGYNINEGNSVGLNESKLIAFLREQETGLILVKGSYETMTGWSKVTSDGVGGVKEDDCE